MKNPLTWLSRRRFPYEPLITVFISRGNLLNNLYEFQRIAPSGQIAPVLKSNAYGHGLMEVASILESENDGQIPFYAVDSYFEAVALRSRGIRTPLLIIGYTRPETVMSSTLKNVMFTITSLDALKQIAGAKRRVSIHVKIDTGMRRQGLLPHEVDEALKIIFSNPRIELSGICSHLCDADNNSDTSFSDKQIDSWNDVAGKFRAKFHSIKHVHLSATDGHRFNGKVDANISRLGIGLYGLADGNQFRAKLDLKPVLKMETIVTGIKKLKKGETIGYGNTFTAEKDMVTATIPVGYYEGLDRRLSNSAFVQVERPDGSTVACPIIGRVSMNIASIDVSNFGLPKIGTRVAVIDDKPGSDSSIMNYARICQTIPYEIAIHIPAHLKRVVVK